MNFLFDVNYLYSQYFDSPKGLQLMNLNSVVEGGWGGGEVGFKKSQLLPSYSSADALHLVYERLCFIFDKEWLEFLLGVNLSVIGNPMHYCRWLWC